MSEANERSVASAGSVSHTPGPWVIPNANIFRVLSLKDNKPHRVIVDCTAESRAWLGSDDIGWKDTDDAHEPAANARLIAAAPDMLAALQKITAIQWGWDGDCGAARIADEAIAKALGQ
jgi:hypothetical protein